MEKTYAVSETLVNEILQYLGGKPYIEVAQLINQIAKAVEPPAATLVPFLKADSDQEKR